MSSRKFAAICCAPILAAIHLSAFAATGKATVEPQLIDDAQLQARSVTVGGATVLPTTRTVAHWWGATRDPNNGITYGYNMVGADPYTCKLSDCDVTVEVDITPIIVNINGLTSPPAQVSGP